MSLFAHRTDRGLRLEPQNAATLARQVDGLLEGDAAQTISGAASLSVATLDDLSFWSQKEWVGEARSTRAGVLLVPFGAEGLPPNVPTVIQVEDPYQAMCQLLQAFHEPLVEWKDGKISWDANIHPTAVVNGTVWPGALIGPHCYVPAGAEVGWNSVLEAHVTLYPGVVLGRDCVLQAGAVVGSRGFGFRKEGPAWVAVPHYGGVEIGDRVHLGANAVVASGFLMPTRIGNDCKFDSFVQIGHHSQVGARVMMASGAGLAGGVQVGDDCVFGGAAQVAEHVHIGAGAQIAAKSGVSHNVAAGAVVAGFPAEPIAQWRRAIVALRQLASGK